MCDLTLPRRDSALMHRLMRVELLKVETPDFILPVLSLATEQFRLESSQHIVLGDARRGLPTLNQRRRHECIVSAWDKLDQCWHNVLNCVTWRQ